ncbi:hypothetical protein [Thalassobacillus hwangdonensis]|uniref:Lipoprotein n=1 Tax=Thalassobacillus hwangdonensis TaxID=546108 RepID=A0ABW3L3S4_9BACI
MKIRGFAAGIVLAGALIFVSGCGDESESTTKPEVEEVDKVVDSSDSTQKEETETTDEADETDTETTEENTSASDSDEEQVAVTSGEDAIALLKKELDMEQNEDIQFDDMGGTVQSDEKGSYYTIKLVSQEIHESGGSGTVGLYQVYEDGTYQ